MKLYAIEKLGTDGKPFHPRELMGIPGLPDVVGATCTIKNAREGQRLARERGSELNTRIVAFEEAKR